MESMRRYPETDIYLEDFKKGRHRGRHHGQSDCGRFTGSVGTSGLGTKVEALPQARRVWR